MGRELVLVSEVNLRCRAVVGGVRGRVGSHSTAGGFDNGVST